MGPGLHKRSSMRSYDEIKSLLEQRVDQALFRHKNEIKDRQRTSEELAQAIDTYDRFTLHGLIPDDITDNC